MDLPPPCPPVLRPLMSEQRRISANILWLLGEKLLRLGVSFAIIGLLARHLGPESFGALLYSAGLAALFTALANLGLDTVVVQELVRHPAEAPAILGTAFGLRLLGALLAMVALAAAAPWLTNGQAALLPLVAIAGFGLLTQAFEVIDLWFQQKLQSRHTVLAKLGALTAGSAVKLWLIARAAPVVWFAWALVLDGLLFGLALVAVYRAQRERITGWKFSAAIARRLLRTSWPLVTAGLLVAFYLRLDQVLVLYQLGLRELGFYSAAVKVSDIWVAVCAMVLTSIFPPLAARHGADSGRFARDLQFAFDAMTGLGYAVAVFISLTATLLVPLVFGEGYRDTALVLAVLAWNAPFLFSGGVRAHYLMLENLTVYHNAVVVLGLAANVLLAFWLIPRWGAPGAALAAVVSYALSGWVSSLFFPRLQACGRMQTTALLLPLRPQAWAEIYRRLR